MGRSPSQSNPRDFLCLAVPGPSSQQPIRSLLTSGLWPSASYGSVRVDAVPGASILGVQSLPWDFFYSVFTWHSHSKGCSTGVSNTGRSITGVTTPVVNPWWLTRGI